MKDELDHDLINYSDVMFDSDVQSSGVEGLRACFIATGWDMKRVFWCPKCKKWSVPS